MKRTQPNKDKARGSGFFGFADTTPYFPRGVLLAQSNEYSCVPACARMLILDYLPNAIDEPNLSEAYLRTQFQTGKEGSVIARIPAVLRTNGIAEPYVYRNDLTLADLRRALNYSAVIAVLRDLQSVHVVVVEQLTTDKHVAIRDPLPPGIGSAYWVALNAFLSVWLKTGWGSGVMLDLEL